MGDCDFECNSLQFGYDCHILSNLSFWRFLYDIKLSSLQYDWMVLSKASPKYRENKYNEICNK
jgi:hypothetical protein